MSNIIICKIIYIHIYDMLLPEAMDLPWTSFVSMRAQCITMATMNALKKISVFVKEQEKECSIMVSDEEYQRIIDGGKYLFIFRESF